MQFGVRLSLLIGDEIVPEIQCITDCLVTEWCREEVFSQKFYPLWPSLWLINLTTFQSKNCFQYEWGMIFNCDVGKFVHLTPLRYLSSPPTDTLIKLNIVKYGWAANFLFDWACMDLAQISKDGKREEWMEQHSLAADILCWWVTRIFPKSNA